MAAQLPQPSICIKGVGSTKFAAGAPALIARQGSMRRRQLGKSIPLPVAVVAGSPREATPSHYPATYNRPGMMPGLHACQQLLASACDGVEALVDKLEASSSSRRSRAADDPLRKANFVPVETELPPQPCSVEVLINAGGAGGLPQCLEGGVYIRNGPNQRFPRRQDGQGKGGAHHFFDGDGMLHAVSFKGGQATYSCRFTRTSRFVQEDAAGKALFPKVFATSLAAPFGIARIALTLLRHLLGLTDLSQGIGLANAGVVFHHGKLLALSDDDLPHAVRIRPDGDLVSEGRYALDRMNKVELSTPWAVTSHPKVDPITGEMLAFGYNPIFAPHLTYFRVSKDGLRSPSVAVRMREPSMMHDFALTKHYVVFPDIQVVFRPFRLLRGLSPIVCDSSKTPRFGVLPRHAQDDSAIRWFDAPGCNCFHFLNAWEEEDEHQNQQLVLVVPVVASVQHVLNGDLHNFRVTLTEVRLDMASGRVASQHPICSALNLEMGNINRNFLGSKNRFLYMGVAGQFPNLSAVVKLDLQQQGRVVARRSFSDDEAYASEPFFVPETPTSHSADPNLAQEDHGCVLCLVHHEPTCTSKLLVMEPRQLDLLATITLPRRVPYGFHGLFVSANELASNA